MENTKSLSWSTVAVVVSFVGLILSYSNFEKLLPLSQSNVVFSESDIKVTPNQMSGEFRDKGPFDEIVFSATNIGKATAKDLTFQVYVMPLKSRHTVNRNDRKVLRTFSSSLIHDLDPGSTATVGAVQNFYTITNSLGQQFDLSKLSIDDRKIVVVFCLAYHDALEEGKSVQKIFYYYYTTGTSPVSTLTSDLYGDIPIRLFDHLRNEDDTICPINTIRKSVNIQRLFPDLLR